MIKFFRKIRQKLLEQNRVSKYLLYAFGEIVLVVIGILIALQINDWNENRKERYEELKLLRQIKVDLIENQDETLNLIKRIKVNSYAMDSVISSLKNQKYSNRIPVYMTLIHRKSFFNNSNSGYKLIGSGMHKVISNDSLLKDILQLYEKDFVNIISRQELMNTKIEDKLYPLTNELFTINSAISIRLDELDVLASEVYDPIDFMALSKNNVYLNNLYQLNNTFKIRLSYLESTKEKLKVTLNMLDSELEKLK
ncbi:MAG: hypothetical protein HC798_00150 [Polaribacter sp.]|nr:hypothetical protein [Polaribacter sp.]